MSTQPAYAQIKQFIQQHISSGAWRPGKPVPSESALMQQFGVARMTVNRALRDLAAEGLVRRVQGSGSFVADLHRVASTLSIRDVQEEVLERGHQHGVRVLLLQAEKSGTELARRLQLRSGMRVFHSVLVHLENGVPIQYEDRYVNPAAAPDYLQTDFSQSTPTAHLLRAAPLTEAHYQIEACMPTPEQARALEMARGEPCLVMVRCTVSGPRVASLARLLYPASRYSFAGKFQA